MQGAIARVLVWLDSYTLISNSWSSTPRIHFRAHLSFKRHVMSGCFPSLQYFPGDLLHGFTSSHVSAGSHFVGTARIGDVDIDTNVSGVECILHRMYLSSMEGRLNTGKYTEYGKLCNI